MPTIRSNLILQAKVPAPVGSGFKTLHNQIGKLDKALTDLSNKPFIVSVGVNVNVDAAAIASQITSAIKAAAATVTIPIQPSTAPGTPPTPPGVPPTPPGGKPPANPPTPPPPPPTPPSPGQQPPPTGGLGGYVEVIEKIRFEVDKTTGAVNAITTNFTKQEDSLNNIAKYEQIIRDENGNIVGITNRQVDLTRKQEEAEKRKAAQAAKTAAAQAAQAAQQQAALQAQLRLNRQLYDARKKAALAAGGRIIPGTEKQVVDETGRNKYRSVKIAVPLGGGEEKVISLTDKIKDYGRATRETAESIKSKAKALKDLNQVLEMNKKKQSAATHAAEALRDGFKEAPPVIKNIETAFGRADVVQREFFKSTAVGLGQYRVEVRKVDEATGDMKKRILEGAAAGRYLGDSFLSAVGKVKLWTLATTAVFGTIAAMKEAVRQMRELEQGTILLVRVGHAFSDASKSQIQIARELTANILKLTTIIGGSAIEAQEAAAVFARAGLDQRETLEAVRVSLLAASIAEIEVAESSTLLQAAMLQFNQSAGTLGPTLDTLNSLTNNYRVTMDSLLQSISRTGSVVEEQGGRLSELAAITAILSQRTARSGAEIGNALKTISSRLVAPELAGKLFDEASLSIRNFDGSTKSLSQVLLELRNRFALLTDAQRDQLTVEIAGVRQRNILVAAVEGSVEFLIAEIESLQDSASASEEFAEKAVTLTQAIERLQASLVEIVSNAAGPFTFFLKGAINTLQLLLQVLNSSVLRLPVAILSMAAAFGLVVVSIKAFSHYVTPVIAQVYEYAKAAAIATVANERLAASQTKAALAAAASGQGGLLGKLGKTGPILAGLSRSHVVLGAAIVGVSYAANILSQAYATNNQLSQEALTIAERESETARKKSKAVEIATDAILRQIDAIKQLKAEGGSQDQIKGIEREAGLIASAAGITIPVDLQADNAIEEFIKEAQKARKVKIEAEIQALDAESKVKIQEMADQTEKLFEAKRELKIRQGGGTFGERLGSVASGEALQLAGDYFTGQHLRKIAELEKQIANAKKKGRVDDEEHTALVKQLVALRKNVNQIEIIENKLPRLEANLRKASAALGEFRDRQPNISAINKALDVNQAKELNTELAGHKARLTDLSNAIADLRETQGDALPKELLDAYQKELNESAKEVRKLKEELELLAATQKIAFGVGVLEDRSRVFRNTNINRSRLGRNDNVSGADQLLDLEAERNAILEEGRLLAQTRARREYELQAGRNGFVNKTGELDDSSSFAVLAAREREAEVLVDLREKELELATALRDKEVEIARARKKSTDEALKSLGALSEEDKLRFKAQLAFFEQNPNAKISLADQFAASSQGVGLGQKFFANRFEIQPEDKLADRISKSIVTPEQLAAQKEQAEIDRIKRDPKTGEVVSTDKFVEDRLRAAEQARLRRAELLDEGTINTGSLPLSGTGQVKVDISDTAEGMRDLIGAFERAVGSEVVNLRNEMVERIDSVWRDLRTQPDRRPSTRAVSQ